MTKTKVLITVKTYPTLSTKYDELVCTAGFCENGTWMRIYPIQFRQMDWDKQYKKYDWVEVDLQKNDSDPRPESFRPVNLDEWKIIESIDTNNNWAKRKEIVLQNVRNGMTELIEQAHRNELSLAVFKPVKILDFICEPAERKWDKQKLDAIRARQSQGNLFDETEIFDVVKKLPYKFSYRFKDANGTESTLMVVDWELGQLYWNCLKSANGDEGTACQKVKEKYFGKFTKENEIYFFLGTTREFHSWAKNPFVIIGIFYPRKEILPLFQEYEILPQCKSH